MEDPDETGTHDGSWSTLSSQDSIEEIVEQQAEPLLARMEVGKQQNDTISQTSLISHQDEADYESLSSVEHQRAEPLTFADTNGSQEKSPQRTHKVGEKSYSIELVPILSASDIPHEDELVVSLLKAFQSKPQNEVLEVLHEALMRHDISVPDIRDDLGNTVLHLAARHNHVTIAETLLEYDVTLLEVENGDGRLALEVALHGWRTDFDAMAALLVSRLTSESMRELFNKSASSPPRITLHNLVRKKFEKTVAAVLGKLAEVTDDGTTVVHYDILEADEKGNLPDAKRSDRTHTGFQCIALRGSIDMVNHDIFRLLTDRKWRAYARQRFVIQALLYLLVVFALTFTAVTSASCDDVMEYDSPLQHARAFFEVIAYGSVCFKFISEIRQLTREKKQYFSDFVNIIELLASASLICVLPLRVLRPESHWYVFAVGYLLWLYIIHKYAAIFRTTGIQAQILWRILNTDVLQFSILFAVVNFAFSGCFLLVLRGDDSLHINRETSSFFAILLYGLRTLIEGESVLDYTDTYRTMSIIVIMLFLFVTIVILLNILIAHLSDTYQRIAADADRNFELNLARIIAWMEINDWSCPGCKTMRSRYYTPSEIIENIRARLKLRQSTLVEEIGDMANLLVRKQNAHDRHIMTVKSEVKRMQGAVTAVKTGQPTIKRTLEDVTSELDGIRGIVNDLQKFPEMVKESLTNLQDELNGVKSSVARILQEIVQMRTGYSTASAADRYKDIYPRFNQIGRELTMVKEAMMLKENIPDLQCIHSDETDTFISVTKWHQFLEELPQHEVLAYLNDHYRKGYRVGDLLFCNGETALHIAAQRGHYFVVEKLIDVKADLFTVTDDGQTALEIALDNHKDEIAALLVRRIGKEATAKTNEQPVLRLANYFHEKYSSFVKAVLDSLLDQDTVHYDILEADDRGHTPDATEFDRRADTVFQSLAKWGNKNAVNHIVVRVLIQRKWYGYARRQFVVYLMLYLASLVSLTVAAVKAAHADDVTRYSTPSDTERAVFEVLTLVFVFFGLLIELSEFTRSRLQYFRQAFNWLEGGAALILVVMVPTARFTNVRVHWYLFAVGYFLWSLIVFKYAAIYRQSGAYAQILWHIVRKDIVQFSILFCVINLAFSGSFLLVIKGDGNLHVNNETSSFFGIFFVGLRTMTEGEPVVTYIGPEGYRTMSVMVMLVFLFVTIVILLNILIAQLSDTYTKIQGDANRELEVRMAQIIARIEQNPLLYCCGKSGRSSSYIPNQPTKDVRTTAGVGPAITEDIYKSMEFVATKQVTNQLNALALKDETYKCKDAVKYLKTSTDKQTNATMDVKHDVKRLGSSVFVLQSDIQSTNDRVTREMSSLHSGIAGVTGQLDKVFESLRRYQEEDRHTRHYQDWRKY